MRSFSIFNSLRRSKTFWITAEFWRCASASDLPAESIPTVTNAESGAAVTLPVPTTVRVGISGVVLSALHTPPGTARRAMTKAINGMRGMVVPPIGENHLLSLFTVLVLPKARLSAGRCQEGRREGGKANCVRRAHSRINQAALQRDN